MFRPLIFLLLAWLVLAPEPLHAQKKGEVSAVRREPVQGVQSVSGEPVQSAEVKPLEEQGARAMLTRLGQAFLDQDAEAVSLCMAETEIPFSLDPHDDNADLAQAPLQSREQIYYRLKEYFELVTVEEFECDCPEENLGVEDAHGVLQLGLLESEASRLFVRLRQFSEGWRVTELRALP